MDNYYCIGCEETVPTEIKKITQTHKVKDTEVTAEVEIRVCNKCGRKVYDKDLENRIEDIFYDGYRKQKLNH